MRLSETHKESKAHKELSPQLLRTNTSLLLGLILIYIA